MDHIKYMKLALAEAEKGRGTTSPNPMVGAVIVKNGKIIAKGWHKRCGDDHAEIDALKKAGAKAKGAILYVTLEPCSHRGRTGPCTQAIIEASIKKVVIGAFDPNPQTHKKSLKILQSAGIDVEAGILEDELTVMNEVFNKYITQKMPFVEAKCAQTLDGKIATVLGESKWITSEEAREYAYRLRNQFDAIMVGINTVLLDDPRLNPIPHFKPIKKIVVDSSFQLSLKAKLFEDTNPSDVIVATTSKAAKTKVAQFVQKGIKVWITPTKGEHQHVDLKWLMKELAKEEIAHVLIEGGGRLIGRALRDGLVDRMMIYIAPKIIGDQSARSSIAGLNIMHINRALELKESTLKKFGPDFLIEGKVHVHRDH
jgi:diaminohydroxyphosphoribosylaminopyrimidine deaminase/5-amino-6-(5-phosphoribosylamino)uracil reductase